MKINRRSFVGTAAVAAGCFATSRWTYVTSRQDQRPADRFDPWIEVIPDKLYENVKQIQRMTNNRQIIAVVKNNAYGLGLVETARLLQPLKAISGFAVVKSDAAIRLRDNGIRKPILLMGMCSENDGRELAAKQIDLSLYTDDAVQRATKIAQKTGNPVSAHAYLDTGLGRMGMPYHRAVPWLAQLNGSSNIDLKGTFAAFTEEQDFDPVQLDRLTILADEAKKSGIELGKLHAASSNGVYHLPGAHFDLVRPGIAIYGGYPSRPDEERAKAVLQSAVRLACRVVRVTKLRSGDSAGYGRKFIADKPTWVATLPAGHVDGVPRLAVEGQQVLINEKVFPIVGAVSASHCIANLGDKPLAKVGDVATLIGPDHDEIHPSAIAEASGVSVYDVFMHLSAELPRYVVKS